MMVPWYVCNTKKMYFKLKYKTLYYGTTFCAGIFCCHDRSNLPKFGILIGSPLTFTLKFDNEQF